MITLQMQHMKIMLKNTKYSLKDMKKASFFFFFIGMWALRVDPVQNHDRMLLYTQHDALHHASVCEVPTVVKNRTGLPGPPLLLSESLLCQ